MNDYKSQKMRMTIIKEYLLLLVDAKVLALIFITAKLYKETELLAGIVHPNKTDQVADILS